MLLLTSTSKSTQKILSLSFVFTLALQSVPASAQVDVKTMISTIESPLKNGESELDKLSLEQLMEKLRVPGMSIAVIKDFKLHWAKTYGVIDAQSGKALNLQTRFQAASISKPITAMAAMRMVQDGRLNLDTDVNTYFKSLRIPANPAFPNQAITPRSLFSHTSGAADGFGFPGYEPDATLPTTEEILEGKLPSNVGKILFTEAPFQVSKYSGGGVMFMQLAMRDISGRPFADLMRTSVLQPLAMHDSSFVQAKNLEGNPNAALAHDEAGQRFAAPWHVYPELATSGLWTTPSDLAKVIIAMQNALLGKDENLLTQQSAREMITPVSVGRFGIGWSISQRNNGWYFSHSGANWGYRAWAIGHIRKGYGLVVMTNSDSGMSLINQVVDRVESAYNWDSRPTASSR
ncbi:serine hydrolase domain-containing protein [Undibacterium flavidum]|uniref:Beta-lactamase family protein n=1 Tax=Undibacterium flavidum TaxID=2762297 RepID=A0ABR6YB10_9BURK|nr:serine hydrolase domain-containing protein [Undibacterium flavidum]MBC3873800.1 beta-lactamase family protein [Undibacterium flavidum]